MAGRRRDEAVLTDEERDPLHTMLSSGKAAARKFSRARLLPPADESGDSSRRTDRPIAATLGPGAGSRRHGRAGSVGARLGGRGGSRAGPGLSTVSITRPVGPAG